MEPERSCTKFLAGLRTAQPAERKHLSMLLAPSDQPAAWMWCDAFPALKLHHLFKDSFQASSTKDASCSQHHPWTLISNRSRPCISSRQCWVWLVMDWVKQRAKRMSAVKMLLPLHFISRRIHCWFLKMDGNRALDMIHIWLLGKWRVALPTVCVKSHNILNDSTHQSTPNPKCFVQSTAYRLTSQPLPVLARQGTARTYCNFASPRNGSDPHCSSPRMLHLHPSYNFPSQCCSWMHLSTRGSFSWRRWSF